MKNNYLLTLLCLLLSIGTAHAEWNIETGKVYYITCDYTDGWLGLGQYQNSGYPLLYQTSGAEKTDDAWWLITPDGDGYTIQNNLTKQYLTWCDTYDPLRYLDLTDKVVSDEQRWTLTDNGDGIVIRSLYKPELLLNTRVSSIHFVALYQSSNASTNSIFHIWDKDGNEVTNTDSPTNPDKVLVTGITLSGKTTMEIGETQQLSASVMPEDADNTTVRWESDDSKVASVDANGLVKALRGGTATITATANDGSGVTGSLTITIADDTYMDHGKDMLYLRHFDSLVTVIPKDYVSEYELSKKRFTAKLANGETLSLKNIMEVTEATPKDIPAFSVYKFNNKYNHQVFTDAFSADPSADVITVSVACIGKWLTASFQTADEYTRVEVDGKLQKSKRTRQSFAEPVTYQLTNPKWEIIKLRKQSDGTYKQETAAFVREQTVEVTFTTDNSTNDYTVPRIDITLLDKTGSPTGEWGYDNYIDSKTHYTDAQITIQGGGVFPNLSTMPVKIKGRGNSSWSSYYMSKNPYRLKFDYKQKPLGMTAGKNWVLLANKQSGSMTTNAIGMKLANLLGAAGANNIVPVELYINGSYRGSYNLTEKVGFSNNSIDLTDESLSAMIEMDTYNEYDEDDYGNITVTYPDNNNPYEIDCKVKEPDMDQDYKDQGGTLTQESIFSDYYYMMEVLKKGNEDYTNLVDVDYLTRFLSANEAMNNLELYHPKSAFVYSEDVTNSVDETAEKDPTPWIFGPVWDCDWAFGYQNSHQYFVQDAETDYFDELIRQNQNSYEGQGNNFWSDLRYNSEQVDRAYYKLWTDFINAGGIQEMLDYCDEYYDFAKESFFHNEENETSNQDNYNYANITTASKTWLETRLNHIYSNLTTYPLTPEEEDEDNTYPGIMGDVNSDGAVSAADLVSLLNHLDGQENDTFIQSRADIDANGSVTSADEEPLLSLVWNQAINANRHNHLPQATISMKPQATIAKPQSMATVKIQLVADEGKYSALQMDVQLPLGVELDGVDLPADMAGMTARTHLISDGLYRVAVYGNGQQILPDKVTELGLRVATANELAESIIFQNITSATSLGEEERLAPLACRLVVNKDGTDGLRNPGEGTTAKRNGILYDLSGRAVRAGQNHKGIYIKNGRKYVK